MSDERQILDYAKPPRTSGDGFRWLVTAICVLAGAGIIWYGAASFFESADVPLRARPWYVFVASIVCGLLVAGLPVPGLIQAIRTKRNATINGGGAGE